MTRHASAAPRGADTESTADLRVKLGEKAEALAQQLLVNHSQEQEILALSSKLLLGESEHQQETCELKRELNAAAATITSLKAQLEAYKLSASSAETNQLTQQREGFMNSLDPKVPISWLHPALTGWSSSHNHATLTCAISLVVDWCSTSGHAG